MSAVARISTHEPRAPMHLSRPARDFWRTVTREYVFEPHHVAILNTALEAWDRAAQARALVEKEGLVIVDRFGQSHPHPAVNIERDARAAFLRAIKQLDLDLVPPSPVGRPPSGY